MIPDLLRKFESAYNKCMMSGNLYPHRLRQIDDPLLGDQFLIEDILLATEWSSRAMGGIARNQLVDLGIINQEIQPLRRRYNIQSFTEAENPKGAFRAQQIQGESYLRARYVNKSGLDPDGSGRLHPDLDRTRGERGTIVNYRLGLPIDPQNMEFGEGSLRVVTAREGGSLDDLAAYRYTSNTMSEQSRQLLERSFVEQGSQSVKEIAALSMTDRALFYDHNSSDDEPSVAYELIRDILHDAIRGHTNEKWIITFAKPAYRKLLTHFGSKVLPVVGEEFEVDIGDTRTSDTLRLIPVIVEPCVLLDNIVTEINDLSEQQGVNDEAINVLSQNLFFMADGLSDEELSEDVKKYMTSVGKLP